jgi:hypothetical protein
MHPLLENYEKYYGKKEEPKITSISSAYRPGKNTKNSIATLEALLEDLKSGRATLIDCKSQENFRHLAVNPIDYFSINTPSDFTPLPVDTGSQITLTIFRKY